MTKVTLSRDLAAAGYTYAEQARMARAGQLVRVRGGAYTWPADSEPSARTAHRQLIAATVGQATADAVVSHLSAAVLHGLPIWND